MFGGPGWSRSVKKDYKKEGGCVLKAAPLAVGTGAVDLAGGKGKRLGSSWRS